MNKRVFFVCIFCCCLLFSCTSRSISTISNDNISSQTPDYPFNTSDTTSDAIEQDTSVIFSYAADESQAKHFKASLEKLLKFTDTERFANSNRLNIISGIKSKHNYEEAIALLNDFRNTTQNYNWYKKVPLTTEAEETGTENEIYFNDGGIICYDNGFATDNSAQTHMLNCDETSLTFFWEYRYLSPKISVLCNKDFDNIPEEEDFKLATEVFFKTYLPKYYTQNTQTQISIDEEATTATAVISASPMVLDPDNTALVYSPILAELKFCWDKDELNLANNGEKALLHELTLYYPQQHSEINTETIISANEAWTNIINGNISETNYDSKFELSFDIGEIFIHRYFIKYYSFDNVYRPCYVFICSTNDCNTLFSVITDAF